MRRKFLIGILVTLLFFSVSCRSNNVESNSVEDQPVKDIQLLKAETEENSLTIRNVSHEMINYIIKPEYSVDEPLNRSLNEGEIDRFPGDKNMEVSFKQNDTLIEYLLDAGEPYSFRYDENDKIDLYDGSHGKIDVVDLAPYVATPMDVVNKMLEWAEVKKSDILYDLGCGDGRIVITAAQKYGTRGVGIDLDPRRIQESKFNAKQAGVEELVEFRIQDVTKADFSEATVVTLYLLTESNELLRPYLEKQLKPGTYVVSHNYSIPGWEDKETDFESFMGEDEKSHSIYVYKR